MVDDVDTLFVVFFHLRRAGDGELELGRSDSPIRTEQPPLSLNHPAESAVTENPGSLVNVITSAFKLSGEDHDAKGFEQASGKFSANLPPNEGFSSFGIFFKLFYLANLPLVISTT